MRLKDWDRNLKIRLFGEFIVNVLFWMFFPFMSVYFADSFGKETAGMLLVLSQMAGVFANLIGGWCADQFGRRRMMEIAAGGQAGAFLLFALTNSPWYHSPGLSFACFTVLGICGSLYWPASHAMVADLVEEKHRSEVFAVFYTAVNISVVIGPILGGAFFFRHRFALLLFASLSSLALTLLIALFIRETAPRRPESFQDEEGIKWYRFIVRQLANYRIILSDKNFMLYILAGILVAQTFLQLDLSIAVYVSEEVPVQTLLSIGDWSVRVGGATFFSWLVAENGLLVTLLTVWVSRVATRFRERSIFVASPVLYGVAMLVLGGSVHLWSGIFAILLFTAGELLVVGIQESFISKLAPEHMRGQYFAAASLRFTIGRTIAPVAIPLYAWLGHTWTFVILGGLAFLGAWVYHLMFRRMEHGSPVKQSIPPKTA
jgi:DHA1 family multidrug resistance protein B-like MFS transporter